MNDDPTLLINILSPDRETAMNAPAINWIREDHSNRLGTFFVGCTKFCIIATVRRGTQHGRRFTAWDYSITERAADGSLVCTASEGTAWNSPKRTIVTAAGKVAAAFEGSK